MIRDKDFTGKLEFKYWETEECDRTSWTQPHWSGGIEVIVPEQTVVNVYGQKYIIPEHKELITFTEEEMKHLKFTLDKIKKRVKSSLNK